VAWGGGPDQSAIHNPPPDCGGGGCALRPRAGGVLFTGGGMRKSEGCCGTVVGYNVLGTILKIPPPSRSLHSVLFKAAMKPCACASPRRSAEGRPRQCRLSAVADDHGEVVPLPLHPQQPARQCQHNRQ